MTAPRRLTRLEFEEWPAADQRAWVEILRPGDPLDEGGQAAHWATGTQDMYRACYGRWLAFLAATRRLEAESSPTSRVTPMAVAAYLASLEGWADYTALIQLRGLLAVSQAMAPDRDWAWLRAVIGRLQRRGPRIARPKHPRLKDSAELFEEGLALMGEAEQEPTLLQRAAGHRDGLMLALLAARPLRCRNLAMIEFGRHLVRVGDTGWHLLFADNETKTHRPIELPWPERLNLPLESYLNRHRPVLLGGRVSDRLWINRWGQPMKAKAILARITEVTARCFGQSLNPHLFRDCFATSIAIHDPEHIRAAAILLGHSGLRTTEKHYNQARALEASRLYQRNLLELRRRLAPVPAGQKTGSERGTGKRPWISSRSTVV